MSTSYDSDIESRHSLKHSLHTRSLSEHSNHNISQKDLVLVDSDRSRRSEASHEML
jgi:hypothetical protein